MPPNLCFLKFDTKLVKLQNEPKFVNFTKKLGELAGIEYSICLNMSKQTTPVALRHFLTCFHIMTAKISINVKGNKSLT